MIPTDDDTESSTNSTSNSTSSSDTAIPSSDTTPSSENSTSTNDTAPAEDSTVVIEDPSDPTQPQSSPRVKSEHESDRHERLRVAVSDTKRRSKMLMELKMCVKRKPSDKQLINALNFIV